ncbi:hypothetical protein P9X10_02630 [Bacillus cereus]|nr:hypothetical protein [Bacillus cereus]
MAKSNVLSFVVSFLAVIIVNFLLQVLFQNMELSIVLSLATGILVYYGFTIKDKEVSTQEQ